MRVVEHQRGLIQAFNYANVKPNLREAPLTCGRRESECMRVSEFRTRDEGVIVIELPLRSDAEFVVRRFVEVRSLSEDHSTWRDETAAAMSDTLQFVTVVLDTARIPAADSVGVQCYSSGG